MPYAFNLPYIAALGIEVGGEGFSVLLVNETVDPQHLDLSATPRNRDFPCAWWLGELTAEVGDDLIVFVATELLRQGDLMDVDAVQLAASLHCPFCSRAH